MRGMLGGTRTAAVALFAGWLCGAGCEDRSATEADRSEATTGLEVGTGVEELEPLADEDALAVVRGCQGTHHVWVSLRATGYASRGLVVRLALERVEDGAAVSEPFVVRIALTAQGGELTTAGIPLPVPDPDAVVGRRARLVASVTDGSRPASDARVVRVVSGGDICGPGASLDGMVAADAGT